jgi:hypothetical protein
MGGRARNRVARCRLRLTAKVVRYDLQSAASRRRADSVRVQVPARVVLKIFRRSVVAEYRSVSDPAVLRRKQARVPMSVAARNSDHNLRLASQRRLRVKRVVREKEAKVPMVNLAGHHHQERVERPLLAVRREVDRQGKGPSVAKSSHNAERSNQREERHAHNNCGGICDSGFGTKNSGAAFLAATSRCSVSPPRQSARPTTTLRSAPRLTQRL